VLEEDADGVVHHRFWIAGQVAGEVETAGQICAAAGLDEVEGCGDSGAPPQRCRRRGELVERREVAAGEVAADDAWCGPVDHAPGGDAVVAAQVELVQRLSVVVGQASSCLEVEDAERRQSWFVGRVVEQCVDLVERKLLVCLGGCEQVAHP